MEFQEATLRILAKLELRTVMHSPVGVMLQQFLQEVPHEITFSVSASHAGLQKLPGARLLPLPIEIVGWLEDVGDEIFRVGLEQHKTCKCGCTEEEHILSAFLIYLDGYVDASVITKLSTLVKVLEVGVRECLSDFQKFKPSEN